MMIDPKAYVDQLVGMTYRELIKERDELISAIRYFEKYEMNSDKSGDAWRICPSPEVRYQVDLGYLAELCKYMQEKYLE